MNERFYKEGVEMTSQLDINKLRTPIIHLPVGSVSAIVKLIRDEVGLSKSQEELLYQIERFIKNTGKEEDRFVSLIDFFEYEDIERSWPIKLLNRMSKSSIVRKTELDEPSIVGRKPTVYTFADVLKHIGKKSEFSDQNSTQENNQSPSLIGEVNKEASLAAAAQEVFISEQSVSFNPTGRYIKERPSTYIDILRTIMETLPSNRQPGSVAETFFNLNGKEVPVILRTIEGEHVANDSDIKTLIVLCMFAENIIYEALEKKQEISLTYPFEIEISNVVKALWDMNKSGGGYNTSVMESMKRMSRTEISAISQSSEFSGFWDKTEYDRLDYDDEALVNNHSFRILPEYSAFFRENERKQRVRFTLHRGIMNALKHRVIVKRQTGIDDSIGSFISNQIVKQKDVELLRLALMLYGILLENNRIATLKWSTLAKMRNRFDSQKRYVTDIVKRIKKRGERLNNGYYRLDGLVYRMTEENLIFAKEDEFKKRSYEENLMLSDVRIELSDQNPLLIEDLEEGKHKDGK